MKSFFWRAVICILPVAITGWVMLDAGVPEASETRSALSSAFILPEHQRFHYKLGVDLRGGTILVYEMDLRKLEEKRLEHKEKTGQEEAADIFYKNKSSELASALKQRIDPTATFNIVIRPAGTEGRVEIIIPTGDPEKVRLAEKAWERLLDKMEEEWFGTKVGKDRTLQVQRGRIEELVDQIQQKKSRELWESKLLNNKAAWERLIGKLKFDPDKGTGLAALNVLVPGSKTEKFIDKMQALLPGKIDALIELLSEALNEPSTQKLESDIRQYAWDELIVQLVQWDELKKAIASKIEGKDSAAKEAKLQEELKWLEEDLRAVPADSFSELVGRVQTKGNVVSQAALDSLRHLMGEIPVGILTRGEIEDFITKNYGPSARVIEESINKAVSPEDMSLIRDPSLEDVQKVKDLVSKVGALEFKMLANKKDDAKAIKEIMDLINSPDPNIQKKLEEAAINGLPPPVVTKPGKSKEPESYKINLARKYESEVTYSWVELGKQERRMLGFSNDARTDSKVWRKKIWLDMQTNHNKAIQVKDPRATGDKFLWEGALFYRRECKDRNLPDKERRDKKYEYFVLARNPEFDQKTGEPTPNISGKYLRSATASTETGRPAVSFIFNEAGGSLFGTLTGKNVPEEGGTEDAQFKRHLAIILDGLVMSAPTINSKITTHGQITGDFTRKEVDSLVNILRSGALPATLKPQPVSETTIGALLGQDTISAGITAVLYAFVAVLAFMCIYYRFAGFVACVALLANLILTVGFMVLVQATFTLPGMAGLVLMLGMALDANFLIYERLREERDRGASLALALRNGYERALPTIIDTHLTSIFTAIVMYAVGTDQLKGFAISLTVGLIISLFTSLYMTHVIFQFWLAKGWLKRLTMMRFMTKPNINFMGIRNAAFTVTTVITILGLILFLARTPRNLDIDFKGGTAFTGELRKEHAKDIQGLRNLMEEKRQKELLQVASVKQTDQDGFAYQIVYKEPGSQETRSYELLLSNRPEGDEKGVSAQYREALVKDRASGLLDWSVEQIFYSGDLGEQTDASKSRFFTVRTSEKERALVDVMLVRLFREQSGGAWESLLAINTIQKIDTSRLKDKNLVKLTFANPAATSLLQTTLQRQLQQQLGIDETTGQLKVRFEISGVGQSIDNRYKEMQLVFSPPLQPEQVAKVEKALTDTKSAFDSRPQPQRLENFDSELAADTRMRAVIAIFVSWVAIVLYLWFRFGSWTFGLAAVLCLVHDLCFTLGLVALSAFLQPTWFGQALKIDDFKIDLNAVAALLTLVGYSVSDTIVVFDRIREVRGKNPELTPKIINDSINQTLSRTILTGTTTLLVVCVLYWIGGPGVHLFAFIILIGVIIGTFSSIYVASPLLLILGEGQNVEGRQRRTQPVTAEAPA